MKAQIRNFIEVNATHWQSDDFAQIIINAGLLRAHFINMLQQNNIEIDENNLVISHNFLSQTNALVVNGIINDINLGIDNHGAPIYGVKIISHIIQLGDEAVANIPPNYNVEQLVNEYENVNNKLSAIRNVHSQIDLEYIERSFYSTTNNWRMICYFFITGPINHRL